MEETQRGGNIGRRRLRSSGLRLNQENNPPASSSSSYSSSSNSSPSSSPSSRSSPSHEFARKEKVVLPDGRTVSRYHCECGKYYTTPKALRNHRRTQEIGKMFKCSKCIRVNRFATHRSFKKHMCQFHNSAMSHSFGCHGCGEKFQTFRELSNHRRLAGHPVFKLGKPKIGPPPSPNQPLITTFFRRMPPLRQLY